MIDQGTIDILVEIGQELDSSRDETRHNIGQFLLFLSSILDGMKPAESGEVLTEYERRWKEGIEPYTL